MFNVMYYFQFSKNVKLKKQLESDKLLGAGTVVLLKRGFQIGSFLECVHKLLPFLDICAPR